MKNIIHPAPMPVPPIYRLIRGRRSSDRGGFRIRLNWYCGTARFLQQSADRYVRTSACNSCTRGLIDKPLNIDKLGRLALELPAPKKEKPTGHTIAVIGGGPAGLSAAWQLALKGHSVDLYEAMDKLGGKIEYLYPPGASCPMTVLAEGAFTVFRTRGQCPPECKDRPQSVR